MASTTSTTAMTVKERWLAAVDFGPVDHLPFWAKLCGAYPRAQQPPHRDLSLPDLHRWMGSGPQVGINVNLIREKRLRTSIVQTRANRSLRCVYRVPGHEMVEQQEFDEASQSWHPVVFPIKNRKDLDAMRRWYDDLSLELDEDAVPKARQVYDQHGQDAVVACNIGKSPMMHWVELLAGVENAHYLLTDYPGETRGLFESMQRVLLRRAQLLAEHHPADLFYLIENTSTTLISVDQYRRLNYPQIKAVAQAVRAAGKRMILHMCGHLKALLEDLDTLPVRGFEAFTAPTLGNTTLLDGRTRCPDKALIGGTHAMLWLEPAPQIIAQVERWLAPLPHHRGLVLSSAGVMPPACRPETIREVARWIARYRPRL